MALKPMFDYLIVTHLPAFYKVNLYNKLAEHLNIHVIFIGYASELRTQDFVTLDCGFEYTLLNRQQFETRNKLKSIYALAKLLRTIKYHKVIVGGWDLAEFWWFILLQPKAKNCLALESTVVESSTKGLKGWIKRLFLRRVSRVFASGATQVSLLASLNYTGAISLTHGVGLINKPQVSIKEHEYRRRFLFLGRLSPEKNLQFLIEQFNQLTTHSLSIVGNGPLLPQLQALARSNIQFYPHVENNHLAEVFQQHDVLILASLSEPWGLVVEEALYHKLPVLVSKYCGVAELVEEGKNGFIFDPKDKNSLITTIAKITLTSYEDLSAYLCTHPLAEKDQRQIKVYCDSAKL